MSRAVCCRLVGEPELNELLPEGYRLNHPDLGRVIVCTPSRETEKTKPHSINWCHEDERPELTSGVNGTSDERLDFIICDFRMELIFYTVLFCLLFFKNYDYIFTIYVYLDKLWNSSLQSKMKSGNLYEAFDLILHICVSNELIERGELLKYYLSYF